MAIEIVTPEVADVRVMDGGIIQTLGGFPQQAELEVAVGDGGVIDLRSMNVDIVAAAIHDGGRILTKPQKALIARVERGGGITYWGTPRVTSRVRQGGVVSRGAAADANRPLREVPPFVPDHLLPVPPVPPLPPVLGRVSL